MIMDIYTIIYIHIYIRHRRDNWADWSKTRNSCNYCAGDPALCQIGLPSFHTYFWPII